MWETTGKPATQCKSRLLKEDSARVVQHQFLILMPDGSVYQWCPTTEHGVGIRAPFWKSPGASLCGLGLCGRMPHFCGLRLLGLKRKSSTNPPHPRSACQCSWHCARASAGGAVLHHALPRVLARGLRALRRSPRVHQRLRGGQPRETELLVLLKLICLLLNLFIVLFVYFMCCFYVCLVPFFCFPFVPCVCSVCFWCLGRALRIWMPDVVLRTLEQQLDGLAWPAGHVWASQEIARCAGDSSARAGVSCL